MDSLPNSRYDDQPYLQQKGELEAEEKRKFELHGEYRRYELDGDNEISEMSTAANAPGLAVPNRPELRGDVHGKELRAEEHSKELE